MGRVVELTRTRGRGKPNLVDAMIADLQRAGLPIWGQLSCESTQAFERFTLYRDAGPGRSLAALGKQLGYTSARVPGSLARMSKEYRWAGRAKEYDMWVVAQQTRALETAFAETASDWAARQSYLREQTYVLGERLLRRAEHRLDLADGIVRDPDTGKIIETLPPDKHTPLSVADRDLMTVIKTAISLMGQSVYMSPVQDVGAERATLPSDLREASDEQLLRWAHAKSQERSGG